MQVGHAISVLDSEGSHLLPDDLGPGSLCPGFGPKKKIRSGPALTRKLCYGEIKKKLIFQIVE